MNAAGFEVRRMIGGRLLLQGRSVAEVAKIIGVSWTSAKRWKVAVDQGGIEALQAKPHPGKPPRLSARQKEELNELLLRGAVAAGFSTNCWTCARVADLIQRHFGVSYHKDYVGFLLRHMGWSFQLPQRRDRKQDPHAVERFRRHDWQRIVKRGRGKMLALHS